jgi:hypothetical protein
VPRRLTRTAHNTTSHFNPESPPLLVAVSDVDFVHPPMRNRPNVTVCSWWRWVPPRRCRRRLYGASSFKGSGQGTQHRLQAQRTAGSRGCWIPQNQGAQFVKAYSVGWTIGVCTHRLSVKTLYVRAWTTKKVSNVIIAHEYVVLCCVVCV